MIYAPWLNADDEEYARISTKLSDIPQLVDIRDKIMFGGSLKELWPEEEVILKLEKGSGGHIPDYVPNSMGWMVVSERLMKLLVATGEDFEVYPVSIKNHKGRIHKEPYYLAQLVGSLSCMDMGKSEYRASNINPNHMARISRLVLDESKIPEGKKIFRLGEMRELMIVNQELGVEIHRTHSCTGMFFQRMEDYGELFRD